MGLSDIIALCRAMDHSSFDCLKRKTDERCLGWNYIPLQRLGRQNAEDDSKLKTSLWQLWAIINECHQGYLDNCFSKSIVNPRCHNPLHLLCCRSAPHNADKRIWTHFIYLPETRRDYSRSHSGIRMPHSCHPCTEN